MTAQPIDRENKMPVNPELHVFHQKLEDVRFLFRAVGIRFERVVPVEMREGEPYAFRVMRRADQYQAFHLTRAGKIRDRPGFGEGIEGGGRHRNEFHVFDGHAFLLQLSDRPFVVGEIPPKRRAVFRNSRSVEDEDIPDRSLRVQSSNRFHLVTQAFLRAAEDVCHRGCGKGESTVFVEEGMLEHEPLHQEGHQPVIESPSRPIGLAECRKPMSDDASGQEKNEGKKVYNTATAPVRHAMLRGN
jgi:hypothetical protein